MEIILKVIKYLNWNILEVPKVIKRSKLQEFVTVDDLGVEIG